MVHVTSPKRAMAEVAKTNEQGGVLYDPKIETSHRKNRCTKLVKWLDDPVFTGSYPRKNDGAKIFWLLVTVDARGSWSAIYTPLFEWGSTIWALTIIVNDER
jgi:hypothetical protein